MITRYDFGRPLDTGAVVQTIPASTGDMPFFTLTRDEKAVRFSISLTDEEMIFGLGEAVGGINKRGHRYVSWNSDDPNHTEEKSSLYGAHNFLVFVRSDRLFGVYFDDPGEMVFDLGSAQLDEAAITSVNGDLSVYVITEEYSAIGICRAFRELTGRSYVPPKWGMGYIQSRWGYKTPEDLLGVLQEHRARHIPIDSVSMDIDYMDDYRDFTWDPHNFPDLAAFSASLREEHGHLVPIIDAGVKLDPGYDVYDEAIEKDLVCKKADGTPFVGAVWPGRCVFPDFLKPEARQWFGDLYHRLLSAGFEGFWNDMNEPALFYSDETLSAAFEEMLSMQGQNLDINGTFHLKDVVLGIANNRQDYRRFYHEVNGEKVNHERVHNLYGAYMTKAAAEGFRRFNPDKRFLLFSRSSFIGAHRDGGIWQGDNQSWWSHILLNLKELPSLNMCGFLFNGADLGGFGSHTTPDLVQRWLQLGVFTPLMRNHSALGTRDQEIYRFQRWEQMRDTLTVRYALLPYLYSQLMQAALTDGMLFRPLAFDYPEDRTACHTEDQLMLGEDCMIAPVYEQNAVGRHVYLPEDMLMVRFTSATEYELVPVPAGHCYVNLALNQFPLFIRKGHVIPLAAPAEYVDAIDETAFTLLGWVDSDTETVMRLYQDDGYTTAPDLEKGLKEISVVAEGEQLHCFCDGLTLDASGILVDQ